MAYFGSVVRGVPKAGFTLFGALKKYWYWIILIIIILPSIITSIQTAIQTNNPTHPFFELATMLFTADQALEKDVTTLQTNPADLIGMDKPSESIWNKIKYGWLFFWKGIYKMMSYVWLIFLPLVIIFKIIHASGNRSLPALNFTKALIVFFIYLFITNTIVVIHGMTIGNTLIEIPADLPTFQAYKVLLIEFLPFHGLVALARYIVSMAINS